VRALGSGHSFNRLADTPGDLVSVAGLPRLIEIDAADASVTVGAGLKFAEVAAELHRAGRALRNLASLPHISVAGACATATHGSGDGNGNLATSVSAAAMVTADGDVVTVSRDRDPAEFPGIVVGLGALGIVTRLTFDTVPDFDIRQFVYEDLPFEQVTRHFDEIMASAYSVSLFTDWRAPRIRQAWLKRRADAADGWTPRPRWMGGRLATVVVRVNCRPAPHRVRVCAYAASSATVGVTPALAARSFSPAHARGSSRAVCCTKRGAVIADGLAASGRPGWGGRSRPSQ